MFDDPRLLVVDDEQVICQACKRVFARQGFSVEESSNAQEGLKLATERDYVAILLDIKMPTMDGLEFLAELRKAKPNVPVILMTGFPSIPNAASAVRLGASDYVTKPFTPEEITQAVQRMLSPQLALQQDAADSWAPASDEFRFCDESWFRMGKDATARIGAMLPGEMTTAAVKVELPKIGAVVFQGLPLAGLTVEGKAMRTVPAPLSGVVVAVNTALANSAAALGDDPCGKGWIAAIAPTRLEEDAARCKARTVVLLSAASEAADKLSARLQSLGCKAFRAGSLEEALPMLRDPDAPAAILDADSFGPGAIDLARRLKTLAPAKKLVVCAAGGANNEQSYRELGIFYYAVGPCENGEMAQILDGLFRPALQARPAADRRKGPSEPVNSICITNRNGKKTALLTGGNMVRADEGLGGMIRQRLLDMRHSLETILGNRSVSPVRIADAASKNDRVVVLLGKDIGRLPGSLVRDAKGEYVSMPGENADRIITLVIQSSAADGNIDALDARTLSALAEHIADTMASC